MLYDPPIEEFSVLLTDLINHKTAEKEELLPAVAGPGILIVTELKKEGKIRYGEGFSKELDINRQGQTFFISANTEIKLEGDLICYEAFVEAPSAK